MKKVKLSDAPKMSLVVPMYASNIISRAQLGRYPLSYDLITIPHIGFLLHRIITHIVCGSIRVPMRTKAAQFPKKREYAYTVI